MGLSIGTKSLLVGSHQFLIHPIYVARAWRKLYGSYPTAIPYWVAFVVHDWGYFGLGEMDGETGIDHPERGASIVAALFDGDWKELSDPHPVSWYEFVCGHSRSYCERHKWCEPSRLMRADKLATAMYPRWLYTILLTLSGEYKEYRDRWLAAGTYPGKADDSAWAYAGHLQANWRRFHDPNAEAGRAFGGE